jgi:hypothetical protein
MVKLKTLNLKKRERQRGKKRKQSTTRICMVSSTKVPLASNPGIGTYDWRFLMPLPLLRLVFWAMWGRG